MGLVLLLLSTLARAGPCETDEWWQSPVSTELAPVRHQHFLRHRELMTEASSGRGASPVFRASWSRMDAELAMQSRGFDPVSLTDVERSRYKDLSLVAGTMAAERFANERVDESDVLSGVRVGVRTVIGPNVVLTRQEEGVKLSTNDTPMHRYPRHSRARLQEPEWVGRPASLRFGAGSSFVDADEEDLETDIGVAWRAYVLGYRWGVDAFRIAVDVVELYPSHRDAFGWSGAWSFLVRERLVDQLAATGELSSAAGSWAPSEASTGLNYQLFPNDRRWLLRSTYTYTLPTLEVAAEHSAELRLVYNGGWSTPTAPDRWPRGQPTDAAPTWYADIPERGPAPPRLIASCPGSEDPRPERVADH